MTMSHLYCCDWGTSSFRLYLVRRQDRAILNRYHSSCGIKTIDREWRASEEPDRTRFFRQTLAREIEAFAEDSDVPTDGIPVLLSGMASSSIGMNELPYGHLPLILDRPEIPFKNIPADETCPWPVTLISGIASSNDVMRGEEIQLLGMAHALPDEDLTLLLPGTHSKHLTIRNRTLTGFKTWMTGELFDVIQNSTILASSLGPFDEQHPSPAFMDGVRDAEKHEWLHTLFTIRARQVLRSRDDVRVSRSYLSGLLIGNELSGLPDPDQTSVIVTGAPELEPLYRTALQERGYSILTPDLPDPLTVAGQLNWLESRSDQG